jgi:acetyl esterase/lipase
MYHEEQLDPELAPIAPAFANFLNLDDIPAVRANLSVLFEQMAAQAPTFDDVVTKDHQAPGPKRAPDVLVRVYRPKNAKGVLPVIYYIHGGGMVLGAVKENDAACMNLVQQLGCAVAAVEYRLAPEHPYPAPMDDCYAGLKWLATNASALKLDTERIAVMGHSAGGGLAAGLALLARDRKEIAIAFQVLIYPMIDDTNVKSATAAKSDHYVWSRANNLAGWKAYLGKRFGTASIPVYAAPARAKKLAGLPPAYIATGDMDLFLQEDLSYAQRLAAAGVPLDLHVYPGAFHSFDSLVGSTAIAQRANADIVRALRSALMRTA